MLKRHSTVKAQSELEAYRRYVQSRMPALAHLLDALDEGGEFNFLDVMAAISQIVAFTTECDQIESDECLRFSEMSGNKCRFCC